jgi:hypothetical protein
MDQRFSALVETCRPFVERAGQATGRACSAYHY